MSNEQRIREAHSEVSLAQSQLEILTVMREPSLARVLVTLDAIRKANSALQAVEQNLVTGREPENG